MKHREEKNKNSKLAEFYQRSKLRIASTLNLFGDVFLFADGVRNEDPLRAIAGGLYSMGAGIAGFFARLSPKERTQELKEKTADFIRQHVTDGFRQSKAEAVYQQAQNKSLTQKINAYLKRNSASVMLWFYTSGAAVLFASGLHKFIKGDSQSKRPVGELLVGGFSLLVKLTSAILPEPEKRTDRTKTKNGWRALKEQPLKIFGYGSLLTEAFWAYETYEKANSKKPWKLTAALTASYALSDAIMTGVDKEAVNQLPPLQADEQLVLEDMLAEAIHRQHSTKHTNSTQKAAQFLSQQQGVDRSEQEIYNSINQKLHTYSWLAREDKRSQSVLTQKEDVITLS